LCATAVARQMTRLQRLMDNHDMLQCGPEDATSQSAPSQLYT
jgi:hypothetical protein